ncbi:hypothetical protein A0H76_1774 [Hepatospora eriocheir]|uniref:Uncharacterized protein n=1 Tax=Hepatospora eriocheir TaxID=1081669 RepID=A0A1X0QGH8_9MICR|nr:hypothetical protein A0H76_1774 [Hepatospora eriocheir]
MIKSEENLEDIGDLNKERIKIDMNMLLKNLDNYSSSFSYLPYLKRMLKERNLSLSHLSLFTKHW